MSDVAAHFNGAAYQIRRSPVRIVSERIGYALFVLFIFFASAAFFEPSPYDLIAPITILLWLALGISLTRHHIVIIACLFFYNLGGFISLIPHFGRPDSVMFMIQSLYLAITTVFFSMFFWRDTHFRLELALKAYAASCVFSSICGILGYFDVAGLNELFSMYGRASGTFKDPNVFGSFLVLGAAFLMQRLLLGQTRWPLTYFGALVIILIGILLSFSRGSWGGTIVTMTLMIGLLFITTRSVRTRLRITFLGAAVIAGGILALMAILSVPEVREVFQERATVTQDYDEGETGRFGNQLRSLPMLLEEPNGFGPLRFRTFFLLDPHNSYINGFASYGWLGGFAFLALVLTTSFVGFRLCLTPSPYQRIAQLIWPATFMFFLQAVQIDIDHWRHVYMLLGMVWALEVARRHWLTTGEYS